MEDKSDESNSISDVNNDSNLPFRDDYRSGHTPKLEEYVRQLASRIMAVSANLIMTHLQVAVWHIVVQFM